MLVDRAWVERNLGFDPISKPPPTSAFATAAAARKDSTPEDLQREIIDFDSEGPEGAAFLAFSKATGLSRFTDIKWPSRLAPQTGKTPAKGAGKLPRAKVLVVTWTVDEGHALSRVLTPGKDSRDDYVPYKRNYAALTRQMTKGSPAVKAGRLGAYWTTTIGGNKAVIFKSESHLSQDTSKHFPANGILPNALVWQQIIEDVQPELVITTGTGGGIGKEFEVGDVIVSPVVRFDSRKWLKAAPFAESDYHSTAASKKYFPEARQLFKFNSGQLPAENTRAPKIVTVSTSQLSSSVVTTDFFGFDTSDNFYKLQGLGDISEMGDAVLGMVAQDMKSAAPRWIAVRNVSDPEIKVDGLTRKQQADMAGHIYKGYGRWSSVCSAIVCWALIAAL
jgi:hypothetical protein